MCKCMYRKKAKNYSNIRQSFMYMYIFILHIKDTHTHTMNTLRHVHYTHLHNPFISISHKN